MSGFTRSAVADPIASGHVANPHESAPPKVPHPTREDRRTAGKAARRRTPLDAHAEFVLEGRDDPVDLLARQAASRVPELVPIRYGRMLTPPLGFYRRAALALAADLAPTPNLDLRVQPCGDAHVSNFGIVNSLERRQVFDVNVDETARGRSTRTSHSAAQRSSRP